MKVLLPFLFADDDSISSARTSSTVGYRDSFGENDDGCFHLLERYDDSSAVHKLLQSRYQFVVGMVITNSYSDWTRGTIT